MISLMTSYPIMAQALKTLWEITLSTLVKRVVIRVGGKIQVARFLGISRPTLYHWLKKG